MPRPLLSPTPEQKCIVVFLDDLESLQNGAAEAADGVIHTRVQVHDFSNFAGHAGRFRCRSPQAIETLGAALEGSDKPLVVTSGTALLPPGRLGTEEDAPEVGPRVASENATVALAERGVRSSVVRPAPSVHGEGDRGFIPILIGVARDKGVSAYIGEGDNRWPAVHRLDAARLYRLALEEAPAGARLHAAAEEGVPFSDIAEVIGRHLDLPVTSISADEADEHFGGFSAFAAIDNPTSSALTRERLGWQPAHPTLIEDLKQGHYFAR